MHPFCWCELISFSVPACQFGRSSEQPLSPRPRPPSAPLRKRFGHPRCRFRREISPLLVRGTLWSKRRRSDYGGRRTSAVSSSPSQMNPTAGGQAGPQSELQDAKAALAAADTQRREQLAVIRSMILQRSELTRQLQALQKRAEDAEAARDAPGAELAAASARIEELSALYASKCRSYDAL